MVRSYNDLLNETFASDRAKLSRAINRNNRFVELFRKSFGRDPVDDMETWKLSMGDYDIRDSLMQEGSTDMYLCRRTDLNEAMMLGDSFLVPIGLVIGTSAVAGFVMIFKKLIKMICSSIIRRNPDLAANAVERLSSMVSTLSGSLQHMAPAPRRAIVAFIGFLTGLITLLDPNFDTNSLSSDTISYKMNFDKHNPASDIATKSAKMKFK